MKRILKVLGAGIVSALCFGLFTGCDNGGSNSALLQYSSIKEGEEIAVIKVKEYGEMKIRFFPDEAPKAVENFITHAKEGYYDGLIFHRVIENFMIQGGDPLGNGTGGESIWGEGFETEISDNLYHFNGAMAMARSNLPNSQGSQFYIVQGEKNVNASGYSKDVQAKYKEVGGYPSLDGDYTVFGQVFEGLEIIDKIAAVSTGANDKPVDDVIIESITIEKYTNK